MVYVVERATQRIVNRCDAGELGGVERMQKEALDAGYFVISREITAMGNMVIWVD